MFQHLIQKFHKKRVLARKLVLVSTFIKETDDYSLYHEAEQAIESVFDWYEYSDIPNNARMNNGGYFAIRGSGSSEIKTLSQYVCSFRPRHALPVIISNSCESFKACLSGFNSDKTGIINLNQTIDITRGISFIPMQNYIEIVAENTRTELLSLGVDEEVVPQFESEAAASAGVQWINHSQFYSAATKELDDTLERFISRNEIIALNIDLRSVVREFTVQPPFALEFDSVLFVIQKVMASEKLIFIHLTGDTEMHLFSRETKKILDKIRTKYNPVTCAHG